MGPSGELADRRTPTVYQALPHSAVDLPYKAVAQSLALHCNGAILPLHCNEGWSVSGCRNPHVNGEHITVDMASMTEGAPTPSFLFA